MTYHRNMTWPGGRSKRIYIRFLLTYVAVFMLPLLILNVMLYRYTVQYSRRTLISHNEQTVARINDFLQLEYQRMTKIGIHIRQSLNIRQAYMEDSLKIHEVQDLLGVYVTANQFVDEIIYYPKYSSLFYGHRSVYSPTTLKSYFLPHSELTEYQLIQKLNSLTPEDVGFMFNRQPPEYPRYYCYVVPLEKTTDQDALVLFMIPYQNLARKIVMEKTGAEGTILIMDSKNRLVFSSNETGIPEWVMALPEMNGRDSPELFTRKGRRRDNCYISVAVSPNSGWKTARIVPLDASTDMLWENLLTISLISILILLMELFIIRKALKITYLPVQHIAEMLQKNIREEVPDLESMEKKLMGILYSQANIEHQARIRTFFTRLFSASDTEETVLRTQARDLGLSEKPGELNLVITELPGMINVAAENLDLFLQDFLKGNFPEGYHHICYYEWLTHRLVCLVEAADHSSLVQDMEHLKDLFKEELNADVSFLISSSRSRSSDLHKEYIEIQNLLSGNPEGGSLSSADIEKSLRNLDSALEEGKMDRAEKLILDAFENTASRDDSEERMRYLGYRILSLLTIRIPAREIEQRQFRQQLFIHAERGTELKEGILTVLREIGYRKSETDRHRTIRNKLAEKIKQYVDEHYMDKNFSVQNTADYFGMSISTVSLLFKQSTGMNVSVYTGIRRIEKSKELLSQGRSVKEVVELIGYNDTTSFIRKFKKHTGSTPGEYTLISS